MSSTLSSYSYSLFKNAISTQLPETSDIINTKSKLQYLETSFKTPNPLKEPLEYISLLFEEIEEEIDEIIEIIEDPLDYLECLSDLFEEIDESIITCVLYDHTLLNKSKTLQIKSALNINNSDTISNHKDHTDSLYICQHCGSKNLSIDLSIYCLICEDCNSIRNKIISGSTIELSYNNGIVGRCNTVINKHCPKSSLSTRVIMGGSKYSMNRYYQDDIPYNEKMYKKNCATIKKCCHMKLTNKIINEAMEIYFRTSNIISRGDNKTGLRAASVELACQKMDVPRTPDEISEMFDINTKVLTKGRNRLMKILNKNNDVRKDEQKSADVTDYVRRFCSNLGFIDNKMLELKIVKVINIAVTNGLLDGSTISSITTGAILFVLKMEKIKITKKTIERKCGVSTVTITKCYNQLFNNKDILWN
jgi:transcription initiation factor TFIIIB Brf1 subunit/transcription initiation factor TFIIB